MTSCGAALEPNGCCRQSAQSGSDYHQATEGVAKGKEQPSFPQGGADICPLTGDSTMPGLYFVLIRWHPGY
jgi:hypothetical protein